MDQAKQPQPSSLLSCFLSTRLSHRLCPSCVRLLLFILIITLHVILLSHFDLLQFTWPNPNQIFFAYPGQREVFLDGRAVLTEGIGAVLSGLKPVLLLANRTSAVITTTKSASGHGYALSKYIRFHHPFSSLRRIPCNLSKPLDDILRDISRECERYNYSLLHEYGVFRNCNHVRAKVYLSHPRNCIVHTQNLVRDFTKFPKVSTSRDHICVMRRGGDVESQIMSGKGNQWAIDVQLTLPLLKNLSQTRTTIVSTETTRSDIKERYFADVLSNKENLFDVVKRLSNCKCLFVASASSFATSIAQIVQPQYIVYMVNRTGFSFSVEPYRWTEYGDKAMPITTDRAKIISICK